MNSITRRHVLAAAGALALPQAHAAGYPERDITFISPWSSGGGLDVNLRKFCMILEKVMGANINLENRVGASGTLGVGLLQRSKPDGYTVGYVGGAIVALQPFLIKNLPFKSMDDFQPIIMLNSMPLQLAVRADSPWKNFNDFLKDVKAKPNQIRVGMTGSGSQLELAQINQIANVQIRLAPFSGGAGETMIAMLGGRIEACAGYADAFTGLQKSGQVRVIAVFSRGKFEQYPEATVIGDLPEFSKVTFLPTNSYFVAPKGLPNDIFQKLYTSAKTVVTGDEFTTFAKNAGLVLDPKGPDEIKAECRRLAVVYESVLKFLDSRKEKLG